MEKDINRDQLAYFQNFSCIRSDIILLSIFGVKSQSWRMKIEKTLLQKYVDALDLSNEISPPLLPLPTLNFSEKQQADLKGL